MQSKPILNELDELNWIELDNTFLTDWFRWDFQNRPLIGLDVV